MQQQFYPWETQTEDRTALCFEQRSNFAAASQTKRRLTHTHLPQVLSPAALWPLLPPTLVPAVLLQEPPPLAPQPPFPLVGELDCQLDHLLQDCSLPCLFPFAAS